MSLAIALVASLLAAPAVTKELRSTVVIDHEIGPLGSFPSEITSRSLITLLPGGAVEQSVCDVRIDTGTDLATLVAPEDLPSRIEAVRATWRVAPDGALVIDLGEQRLWTEDPDSLGAVRFGLTVAGVGLFDVHVSQKWRLIVRAAAEQSRGALEIVSWNEIIRVAGPVPLSLSGEPAAATTAHHFELREAPPGATCETFAPPRASITAESLDRRQEPGERDGPKRSILDHRPHSAAP